MFAGKVIGHVVATAKTETLVGEKLLLIQPLTWEMQEDGDPLVAMDAVGAGFDELIFYVKAREAAVTVKRVPPVDAAIVGIIDGIDIQVT
ncbi:MAG: EutN/CcmL family microcompartment protein [bacterium]